MAASQQQRAAAYANYIAPLYEDSPWVVGDEWFEYVDEPEGGRFDGENNNFGVVNVENQPYQSMVDEMEVAHSIAPDRLVQTGPTCDSWADSAGTVTCTAHVSGAAYPPSIVTTSLGGGVEGTPYSGSITAIGGRPGYRFSLRAGSVLPKGLKLDADTGMVSGTPKSYGSFSFGIAVTDSTSPTHRTASRTVSLKIAPRPVTIKTSHLPRAFAGAPYSATLSAASGAPPFTWGLVGGALPKGVALGSGGSLKGTPTKTGTFVFSVRVTDSFQPADTATKSLSLVVAAPRGT